MTKIIYCSRIVLAFVLVLAMIVPNFAGTVLANDSKLAKVSITMLDGKEALPLTDVSFVDGETVFDVLKRVTTEYNITLSYRSTDYGKYIEGINELYEFDEGPLSGWMYSVNGQVLNYSADLHKLKEGDYIAWMYTKNLGQDVGDTITNMPSPEVVIPPSEQKPESSTEVVTPLPEQKTEQSAEVVTPSEQQTPPSSEIVTPSEEVIVTPKQVAKISITMLNSEEALPSTKIELEDEDSVFDVLKKVTKQYDIPLSYRNTENGKYVEGINGLYEFDEGPLSGWMYSVNGEFPNYSSDLYEVGNGDRIEWVYTKNLGKDVEAEVDEVEVSVTPQVIKQDVVEAAKISPEQAYNHVAKYMLKTVTKPSYGNEWFVMTLARGNYAVPVNYYETYYQNVVQHVKFVQGELNNRKYTEYARVILALSSIGKDAQNIGGYNLVEKLYDFNKVVSQGVNGPIFALIALDSQQYTIPKTATNSRDKMIDYILSKQLADGGFALSGTQADADMTAMAIQALSTYNSQPKVKAAIDKAVAALANLQQADGSYVSWDVANSESVAQVIMALTSLNIDPTQDARFTTTMNELLSFYNEADGGFKHTPNDTVANGIATEQAGYALAAYKRLLAGQTKFYDMTDVKIATPVVENTEESFTDTTNHWAKPFIDEAVQLKLLKGFNDGTFKPQQDLTRVQAASIIVRTLGLTAKGTAPFADVTSFAEATKEEIAAAYEAGIIKGNNGLFKPNDKVTRMQLALMLARAYAHKQGQAYVSSQQAPFSDTIQYNDESKQAVAMLHAFGIVTGSSGLFKPEQFTTRAQAAKMLVNFHKVLQEQ